MVTHGVLRFLCWLLSIGLVPHAVFALQQTSQAASYVVEQWGVRDGLPVNSVNGLAQDDKGYVWLTTFDGLVRYDGVQFTVFNINTTPGLTSNRLMDIVYADSALWLTSEDNQVIRFDGFEAHSMGTFTRSAYRSAPLLYHASHGPLMVGAPEGLFVVEGDSLRSIINSASISAIYEDPTDATYWLGVPDGVLHYTTDRVIKVPVSDTFGLPTAFYRDEAGTLWVINAEGTTYSYQNGGFIETPASDVQKAYIQGDVREWNAQHRYVQLNSSILYANDELVLETASHIRDRLLDREGNLWVATGANGLYRVRPSVFRVYGIPEGLVSANTYGLHEDQAGHIWIATLGGGLARQTPAGITTFFDATEQQIPVDTWTVYEDRAGTLWVGGPGLCRFEEGRCRVPDMVQSSYKGVRALLEDDAGALWVGSEEGLVRYHEGTETHFTTGNSSLSHNAIRNLYTAADGALWIATSGGGVMRYQDGFFDVRTEAEGLPSNYIRGIYEDAEHYVWLTTEGQGIIRLDMRTAERLDQAPIMWYQQQDGLPDDAVHQILEDEEGRFWMSANRGIFVIPRAELIAFADGQQTQLHGYTYDESSGLRNREANGGTSGAGIKSRDGRLWFPTQAGVVVIDPLQVHVQQKPPPVIIEHITIHNESTPLRASTITLGPDERTFSLAYTGLSFVAPEQMRFRYRLEGYDEEWYHVTRRTAYYTKVPPGTYTFRVVAANACGSWGVEETTLTVHVVSRFYETTWFWIVGGLCTIALFGCGCQWRVRRLRKREQWLQAMIGERTDALAREKEIVLDQAARLQQMSAAKSEFIADISRAFRTPLTLSIGPLTDLLTERYGALAVPYKAGLTLALKSHRHMLGLVNQLLDVSELPTGFVPSTVAALHLKAVVDKAISAFQSLAEQNQMHFDVRGPDPTVWVAADACQMEKLLSNVLHVAFVSTPKQGVIRFSAVYTEAAGIVINVFHSRTTEDDDQPLLDRDPLLAEASAASAFQPDATSSLGLVKLLVEQQGGTCVVDTSAAGGTTFTLSLPLARVPSDTAQGEAIPAVIGSDRIGEHAEATQASLAEPWEETLVELVEDHSGTVEPEDRNLEADTILVVDDHPDMRLYIRTCLASRFQVVEARNGKEALVLAKETQPDVIISDVVMPDMDGYALCAAIKETPHLEAVPVILLTARASDACKKKGLASGADAFLTKPFDAEELVLWVNNLLSARSRLRQRFRRLLGAPSKDAPVASETETYLARIRSLVERHLADSEFSVERLAEEAGQSRSNLHRRLKEAVNLSPRELIITMRLQQAAHLLVTRPDYSVSEVAYSVGFKSVGHFSTRFRKHFGCTPSVYHARALETGE